MAQLIELAGDDVAIGSQYGEQARGPIRETVALYQSLFEGVPAEHLQDRATGLAQEIQRLTPHLACQIEATAEAAGVEPEWLYIANARSEVMSGTLPECTAIASPQQAILAQNWDFIPEMQDLTVLLAIELGSGEKLLTLAEAGMVGKIGLNGSGIGVCLNMLFSEHAASGLPIHVLLRWLLEASDRAGIEARLSAAGSNRVGNVLIGSAEGWGINMEYQGEAVQRTELAHTFVHTNHCLAERDSTSDFHENSVMRHEQACQRLDGNGPLSLDAIDQILSDRSSEAHPVHVPYRTLAGVRIGTLYTVLMDLRSRSLRVRKGQNLTARYDRYQL